LCRRRKQFARDYLGRLSVVFLSAANLLAPGRARFRRSKLVVALVITLVATSSFVVPVGAQNFQGLGFLPGFDYSEAVGVSSDGTRVVGNIRPIGNNSNGSSQAFS